MKNKREELGKVLFDYHRNLWKEKMVRMPEWNETNEENRESWRRMADKALQWFWLSPYEEDDPANIDSYVDRVLEKSGWNVLPDEDFCPRCFGKEKEKCG